MLADDDALVRKGVGAGLREAGVAVLAEVDDASTAVAMTERMRPDVCVIEVLLPGDVLAAIRAMEPLRPGTEVVVLTASKNEDLMLNALLAGAAGVLTKDIPAERLVAALIGVVRGEAALSRMLLRRFIEHLGGHQPGPAGGLGARVTARQWEVLQLLRSDLTTGEIARRLSMSEVTVRRHISDMYTRLDVTNRSDLVRLTTEAGTGD